MNVPDRLFALQDKDYQAFQQKLLPNIAPDRVIGVRQPALRTFAKEFAKTPDASLFLESLPHHYYEENNLHAALIECCGDFQETICLLDRFLPHVDNWATCDMMRPKVFKKHLPELLTHIKRWMASEHTYTARFGLEMLMCFYLDEAFAPEYPAWAAAVKGEDYYLKMMVAWFFATALAKQYEAVLPYIESGALEPWTHNKAIQKAVESYRITPEQKAYLKTLKRK